MIWLKAFGIGLGLFLVCVGIGKFAASWDEYPSWVRTLVGCVAIVGILTFVSWLVMSQMLGMK